MNKISKLELNTLIYFLIRSTCVGIVVNSFLILAKNNSLISIFVSTLIGFLILYFYYRLMKSNISFNRFSKFIYVVLVILLSCVLFTDLVTFVSTQYLYNTPKYIVGFSFLIPLFYIGLYNKKIVSRTGLMLFYFSVILFVIAFMFLFFQVDYYNFMPLMKIEFKEFGLSIYNFLIYIFTPLVMLIDLPIADKKNLKFRNIIPGFVGGILSIFIVLFLIIGIYGYKFGLLVDYPAFQILKRIASISFLERAEHFIFMQWIFDIFITLGLAINTINDNFENKKISGVLFCLMLFVCSIYVFTNNNIFIDCVLYIIPSVLFSLLIVFFITIKKE